MEIEQKREQIESIDGFRRYSDSIIESNQAPIPTIVVPCGTCGQASGANTIVNQVRTEIINRSLGESLHLRVTGCHGFCEMEPSLLIEPFGIYYPKVQSCDIARIIDAITRGRVVDDLLYRDPETGTSVEKMADIPFFKKQMRLLLSANEKIDPLRISDYIANGGYRSFLKVLEMSDPAWIITEIKESQLRGRGGAGFPTGVKWELLSQRPQGMGKYLVCNGDEGDPGAYMDRSILEGNPHSIIEGMLIGACATGATEGIIYVRNEYPLAIKHLEIALEQSRTTDLLGDNILGCGFAFDIKVVKGAGAFVCGEETALIRSIEGKIGEPCQRPPYPIDKGIDGRPTCINNVETWANIPLIIQKGAKEFATIGKPGNSGTKIFSLVGKIRNTGLVEVPMGMSIRDIVYGIGGGPSENAGIKAVQTGGPSGGCIPEHMFDISVDYDSLKEVGSIMGSGGMIVMDEYTCMVDVARYFMNFLKDESCGKCFTCRKGTQRMWEILDDISCGRGDSESLDLLLELAESVKETTMCGLGQTAPNPVLSTMRYYRDEYIEHIENAYCPAGVCKELTTFEISDDCIGCRQCATVCPVGAIAGEKQERHVIDDSRCIACGACRKVCKVNAIHVKPREDRGKVVQSW